VQELGPGSGADVDAAQPPIVMLHGLLLGSLASWYFTAAPALARSRRVILYDLRGHGLSQRVPGGYGVRAMAADLRALLDALAPQPVALVGHSWGALVALRLALDQPARVTRLALVEAPLPPGRLDELRAFAARDPRDMAAALPASLRAALDGGGRRGARLLAALAFLTGESSALADVAAEPDVPDDVLRGVRCPVLLAYGTDSSCLPVGERLARVIPGAHLARLSGGHYLHLDATAALTHALEVFLAEARPHA